MQITPNEIDTVEEAGLLDGQPVKMIRTKGGFWIAVGRLKGKGKEEAIAAGSHPAIVKYSVEKKYPQFQPSMMKSEHFNDSTLVQQHSHFLSQDLRKSGHDIYSVQSGDDVSFHITKHGMKIAVVEGGITSDNVLKLSNAVFPKEFLHGVAGAAVEKSVACGAKKVNFIPKVK